jgi:GTP-binding protein
VRGVVDFDLAFHREQHLMKPVIALVGRPNVGKSTLFNRLTRSRDALVADLPGLTRDRHYGEGRTGERPYLVVDTGGFEPVAKDGILHEMARQTRQAVEESDIVARRRTSRLPTTCARAAGRFSSSSTRPRG